MAAMQHENLRIEIDGERDPGAVRRPDQPGGRARRGAGRHVPARLWRCCCKPTAPGPTSTTTGFTIWKPLVITAGLESDTQQLLTGYITHVRPVFGAGLDQCRLEIWGMDASVLMDREEKLKDWPNKKDSDIATEIFSAYGLTPEVDDTELVHDEQVSTIIQRETDMQFLKRLALRNGFECYVDGDTGYFRRRTLIATTAAGAGRAVRRRDQRQPVPARGQRAGAGAMSRCPRSTASARKCSTATSIAGSQQPLGASAAASYLARRACRPDGRRSGRAVTTGSPEMRALCQGLLRPRRMVRDGRGRGGRQPVRRRSQAARAT